MLWALLFARPHATPGPPMRDFEAYYAAGAVSNAGEDPYGIAIWRAERSLPGVQRQRHELLPFVGPPATLPFWRAISRLPFAAANALWRSVLALCAVALVLLGLRLSGRRTTLFTLVAVAVAGLGFGPLTSAIALGQLALPAYLCAAAAASYPFAGLLAWVQPNIALTLLWQTTRRTYFAFFAGAALFALTATTQYARVLQAHGAGERFSAIQLTPAAIAFGFGAAPFVAVIIGIAFAAGAALVWALLMRRCRNNAQRFCATCALLPLAMPFFHEHDLIVTFIPAIYLALTCARRAWPLVATGALACATDWLGLAQRPDGALQTLLLISAALIAMFLLREVLPLRALLPPAGVVLLAAAAAFAGAMHPAPVWPDSMRLAPALQGSVAGIWHAEQAASGLLRPNPVWAALRCGSLLGCGLLAYAAALTSRAPARFVQSLPVPAPGTLS